MILRENHLLVLSALEKVTAPRGEMCSGFRHLQGVTGLHLSQIRVCCRHLAKRNLAEFYKGLATDEGEFAGSGYCITEQGRKILKERWRPIETADKTITFEEHFPEVGITIRNSDSIWARDEDGREFETYWNDHKDGYWWDPEAESPVDPVEWKPMPSAPDPEEKP